MKAWTRWEDWTNLLLGLWLFAVPWVFGTTADETSSWNAWIVGSLVALVALWALAVPTSLGAEWSNAVLGGWALVSPFVLGFTDLAEAAWNAGIVGVAVFALAIAALQRMRPERTDDRSRSRMGGSSIG
jgi:hypothetical protein